MWVKMCPLLNGLAQISNQVRLGSLRRYITHGPATQPSPGGTALTSELSKAGQTIKNDTESCSQKSQRLIVSNGGEPRRHAGGSERTVWTTGCNDQSLKRQHDANCLEMDLSVNESHIRSEMTSVGTPPRSCPSVSLKPAILA